MRAAELAATRLCCEAFGQRENQSHPRPSPPTDDAVDDAAKSRELSIDELPTRSRPQETRPGEVELACG